jgi:hypothetical protein
LARKAWISLLPSNLCQALESSPILETRTRNSNKNTKQEQEQETATRDSNKNTKQGQEQETIKLSQSVDGSSLFSKQEQEQDGELDSEQRQHEKRSMELLQVV